MLIIPLIAGAKHKRQPPQSPTQPVPDQHVITPYGEFVFSGLKPVPDILGTAAITGVMHNGTTKTWSNLDFHLRLTLADGSVTDDNEISLLIARYVAPGEDVQFSVADHPANVYGFTVLHPLPANVRHAEIVMTDGKCEFLVHYRISLEKPVYSDALGFEDNTASFVFTPTVNGIELYIHNRTDEALKLDWNAASYVDTDGVSNQVTHAGVKYADAEGVKPPSSIPPAANLSDVVLPAKNIRWSNAEWTTDPVLPRGPAAITLAGRSFGLLLPIEANGKTKNYFFQFRINAVE